MMLLLRAFQPGLFDAVVPVKGHATKTGVYVQPHQAKRKKKLPAPPAGDLFGDSEPPPKVDPKPAPEPAPEPAPAPNDELKAAVKYYQGLGYFDINTTKRKGVDALIKHRIGDNPPGPEEHEFIEKLNGHIRAMDEAFAKQSPREVDVWRGCENDEFEGDPEAMFWMIAEKAGIGTDIDLLDPEGKITDEQVARFGRRIDGVQFQDLGFSSTSESKTVAGGFAGRIRIRKGPGQPETVVKVVYRITGKVRAIPVMEALNLKKAGSEQEILLDAGTQFRVKSATLHTEQLIHPVIVVDLEASQPEPQPEPKTNAPLGPKPTPTNHDPVTLTAWRRAGSGKTGKIGAGTFYALYSDHPAVKYGGEPEEHTLTFDAGDVLQVSQEDVSYNEGLPSETLAHRWFKDFDWRGEAQSRGMEEGALMDMKVAMAAAAQGFKAIRYGDLELQMLDKIAKTLPPKLAPNPGERAVNANPEWRDAIVGYAGAAHIAINGSLRNPNYWTDKDYNVDDERDAWVIKDTESAIKLMREAFTQAAEKRSLTDLWRGDGGGLTGLLFSRGRIEFRSREAFLKLSDKKIKKALVGQQFVDQGFISTSSLRSKAEDFAIEDRFNDIDNLQNEDFCRAIYQLEGSAKAFDINDILTVKSNEQEILVQDGQSFEVMDAEWGTRSTGRPPKEKILIITLKVLPV